MPVRSRPRSRPFPLALTILVATVIGLAGPSVAQEPSTPLEHALASADFREIGPAIMGGRVADLDVHPDNPAHWYVGFATGGVWETKNHGMSWTPLFDDEATSSIGDVTLAPSNPNVVWVGTGEPQNRNSSPYGGGVYRSVDSGRSWTHLGLTETQTIAKIAVHPRDPDVAYVAAPGHLWGPNPDRGVYRTTDGGESWEKILYIDEDTGAIDLVMDPNDPKTIFAAMYQRRRTAFGFSAWGPGSGLYRTVDGGDSWHELTDGLPEGHKGRIGIDVWKGDGNLVYATIEGESQAARGLYRSTDRGESWEKMSGNNPRPMYFSMVRIDPSNPDRIYMGGVVLQVSDDGGRSWWPTRGYWEIHVDNHALWIDPNDSNHLVLGNDGGVATSWDAAESWRHHNNLAIGQFYEIGVDMSDPYRVCGGLQDNSSWCAPVNSLDNYGIDNGDWVDIWGGDGFYSEPDPFDPTWIFTESQNGNLGRVNMETGESVRIRPQYRGEEEEAGYEWNWNTPIAPSVHDAGTVYVGSDRLMRSRDRGATWEEASPDLTRGIDRDTLTIFSRPLSESHLSRNDGTGSYGNVTTISESPVSAQVLWVGTDDGNVQVTRDGGASWTNVVDEIDGLPGRRWVSRIEASHHEEGRAYVTFDGHHDDDLEPWVFVTEDHGDSWRRIANGLPMHSVNVVREHPSTPDLLFVGNEIGIFVSVDRGANWHRLKGDFPTVPVDDLVIHPRENDLVVGTHGRSIWVLDGIGFLEDFADGAPMSDGGSAAALLHPIERATIWSRRGGWPFWGDVFLGENAPDGARVRYTVPEALDEEAEVAIVIRDADGATVRTLEASREAGTHTLFWDFNHDSPYEVDEGSAPPGPQALPGRYSATLEVNGEGPTRDFELRLDPRVEATDADLRARHALMRSADRLAPTAHAIRTTVDRIEELVDGAEEVIEGAESPSEELTASVQVIRDRLEELEDAVGRVNGGAGAGGRVRSSFTAPTSDQEWSLARGWEEAPGVVRSVNGLVAGELSDLLDAVYAPGVKPELPDPIGAPAREG